MKKILLFTYDSFAEFEISVLVTCLSNSCEIITCSLPEMKSGVKSVGSMTFLPDRSIEEINILDYDCMIIPGGNPLSILSNNQLKEFVKSFYENKKLIGAICAGPSILGSAGILEEIHFTTSLTYLENPEYNEVMNYHNKLEKFVVVDKNVVTSTGSSYIEFAEEIMRQLGIIAPEEVEPLHYFKVPSMN